MNGSLVPFGIPLPSLGTGFRSFHYSRITSHWRRSGSYVPEGGAGCSSGWPERPGCGSARGELPPPSTRSLVGRCAIPRPSVAGVLSQACGPISSTPLSPIGRNKKAIRFAGHQTSQDRSAATAESLVRGRFDDIGSLGFLTGPPWNNELAWEVVYKGVLDPLGGSIIIISSTRASVFSLNSQRSIKSKDFYSSSCYFY